MTTLSMRWTDMRNKVLPGEDRVDRWRVEVDDPHLSDHLVERACNAVIGSGPLPRDGQQQLYENYYRFDKKERGRFIYERVYPQKD